MRILFFRLLSWITGIAGALIAWWQWQHPLTYPWAILLFLVWYALALVLLAAHRLTWRDAFEKIIPSILVMVGVSLGFLMAESNLMRWIISILFVGIPFLVIELLFLMIFAPTRYPVSGLSRVNIMLIPIGAFFFGAVLNEMSVFLRISLWIPLVVLAMFAGLTFFLTSHPSADHHHRKRWGSLGVIVGLHIAMIGLLLPVSMFVHGALASLCIGFPLRLRRYAYAPKPSVHFAWAEGVLGALLFGLLLVTSRWV
ncbi:hypothetical protein FJZ48_01840 [Candidatus Uhrbacteria bacterium]|nr:hypothetical protein [Candidatus Uhrbacteria bacterium]